ncbi:hypothetical protein EMCRGX_G002681 [Ephydatia muelleri]
MDELDRRGTDTWKVARKERIDGSLLQLQAPAASFTTPLSELVEMALYSSSAACFSGQQRSITFDAGLTCDGSSSGQWGQLTAPDAAMHSVRHLHISALHINSSGCERTLEHSAHFSFFKIDRLFALAKVGLGSCNTAGGEAII